MNGGTIIEKGKKSDHPSSWSWDKIFTSDESDAERDVTNRR